MTVQQIGGSQTREGGMQQLTELLTTTFGTAAKLHLYQSSFSPTNTSSEADFEAAECITGGYAPAAITWSAVGVDSAGQAVFNSNVVIFNVTGPLVVDPNTLGGCWVEDIITVGPPKNSACVRYFPFPVPLPFSSPFYHLDIQILINAIGGGSAVVVS